MFKTSMKYLSSTVYACCVAAVLLCCGQLGAFNIETHMNDLAIEKDLRPGTVFIIPVSKTTPFGLQERWEVLLRKKRFDTVRSYVGSDKAGWWQSLFGAKQNNLDFLSLSFNSFRSWSSSFKLPQGEAYKDFITQQALSALSRLTGGIAFLQSGMYTYLDLAYQELGTFKPQVPFMMHDGNMYVFINVSASSKLPRAFWWTYKWVPMQDITNPGVLEGVEQSADNFLTKFWPSVRPFLNDQNSKYQKIRQEQEAELYDIESKPLFPWADFASVVYIADSKRTDSSLTPQYEDGTEFTIGNNQYKSVAQYAKHADCSAVSENPRLRKQCKLGAIDRMLDAYKAKAKSSFAFRKKLAETGDKIIVYVSQSDSLMGSGPTLGANPYMGENQVGSILMFIRDHIDKSSFALLPTLDGAKYDLLPKNTQLKYNDQRKYWPRRWLVDTVWRKVRGSVVEK